MLLYGEENLTTGSWKREDFPEARLLRAIFHEGLQSYILVHSDDFSEWAYVRSKSIH